MIELASTIREEVNRSVEYFRTLGDAETGRSRGPGKWVKKEILGHLIDSAANNHQRFVWARFTDPLIWPEYDGDSWVEIHRYRERPWIALVTLWEALNLQVAAVIESMPADRLGTSCRIGENPPAPLEWVMRDYLRHMRHHLEQLGLR